MLQFCYAGCNGVPSIEKKTVGKMGLKGVPGLNIASADRAQNGRQQQQRVRLTTGDPDWGSCQEHMMYMQCLVPRLRTELSGSLASPWH